MRAERREPARRAAPARALGATPSRPATATATTPREALADIAGRSRPLAATGRSRVRAFRHAGDTRPQFRFKLYRTGRAAPARRRAADPRPHGPEGPGRGRLSRSARAAATARAAASGCTSSLLDDERGERLSFEAMQAAVRGRPSSPSGPAGPRTTASTAWCWSWASSWREAALIRALARYRQQSGLDPSQAVQEAALSRPPRGRPA